MNADDANASECSEGSELTTKKGKCGVKWRPLEANPEVLSEYCVSLLGQKPELDTKAPTLQFVDVLSTEEWALSLVPQPTWALVLLFPITEKIQQAAAETAAANDARLATSEPLRRLRDSIWFTRQTVGNSCGTVALLHVLMNLIQLGQLECPAGCLLEQFRREAEPLNAFERARLLERFSGLNDAHSHHSRAGVSRPLGEDSCINEHFVALMPFAGELVELDGRKPGPIFVQQIPSNTPEAFLHAAASYVFNAYMRADPTSMRFCLIAVSAGSQQ